MVKKNIILVGFPKSGTNWLSRLIAEIVECSFVGDWGYNSENKSSISCTANDSRYRVYKSHHTFDDVYKESSKKVYKIIYLIRDPRDITISGTHFFSFSHPIITFIKKIRLYYLAHHLRNLYNGILNERMKKKQMINAVLFGNEKISPWLKIPWENHYKGYNKKDILFIKYENLIDFPESECAKILIHLDIVKSKEHIKKCIEGQSFQKRKKEVQNQNNQTLKKLVRKGTYGYWKEAFTEKENFLFRNTLKSDPDFYEF